MEARSQRSDETLGGNEGIRSDLSLYEMRIGMRVIRDAVTWTRKGRGMRRVGRPFLNESLFELDRTCSPGLARGALRNKNRRRIEAAGKRMFCSRRAN